MFTLPKGPPVFTGLPASKDPLPDLLHRLAASGLSGYVRYSFEASAAFLLFESGKLISAMVARGGGRLTGLEALTELSRRCVTEAGTIDAYKLTPDLTMAVHGLLHGESLLRGHELKLIDVKALTTQLKARRLNGCVRVYTASRSALIFYKDGAGFGFFHDGSERIETTATESQKIASLPGAKIDVFSTRPVDQLATHDMLELVNLQKVWDASVRANQARLEQLKTQAADADRLRLEGTLTRLEETLKTVANEHVGSMGKSLVTKELASRGGRACLLEPAEVAALLAGVEKGARLVAGASKVKELVGGLRGEVERHLGPGAAGSP